MRPHKHPDCANGASPEHGALARRQYVLLAPENPAGNPAAVETQGSGEFPKATTETGNIYRRETATGEQNGQRGFLACGQLEDREEER